MDLAAVRTPSVPLAKGHYESTYLLATDPAGGRALWLRDTWLKEPGKPAEPLTWLTWWDAGTVTQARAATDATLQKGELDGHTWDLAWTSSTPEIPYLPRALYDRPFPRSNGVALVPHGTMAGRFDGLDLTGWHAMVGHNWGAEHAPQWRWTHGANGDTWFDEIRVKQYGVWITRSAVNGRTSRKPLDLQITSHTEAHWDYASPSGHSRTVRNCSVADAVLNGTEHFRGTVAIEHGA